MEVKPLFLVLLLLTCSFGVRGQTIKRLGMETNYGFIIPHNSDLIPVSQTNPIGFSATYQWMKTDRNNWEACSCFHYLGLRLSYHNFNNPDVLGASYGLSGTFEPILWHRDHWNLNLNSGIGFTYLNRVYDEFSNPLNTFFSSRLSYMLFAGPVLEYRLSEFWKVQASFIYNHISNGGQSQPNRGINYPMAGLGLRYFVNQGEFPQYNSNETDRSWQFYLEGSFTHRNAAWTSGRKPSISLVGGTYKSISKVNALGGGVELIKDYSLAVETSRWEALMPAPYLAHHFLLGRIDFSQRMAIYTQKPSGYTDSRFYQRYLIQFRVWEGLMAGISLKTHGHVAENIDLRVGWKF